MVNSFNFIKVSIIQYNFIGYAFRFITIYYLIFNLFTLIECCQHEPDYRPDIRQVISELNDLESENKSEITEEEDFDSFSDCDLSNLQL